MSPRSPCKGPLLGVVVFLVACGSSGATAGPDASSGAPEAAALDDAGSQLCTAPVCSDGDAGADVLPAATLADGMAQVALDGSYVAPTTCTLDGGECPAGWQCACNATSGPQVYCTCYKQCTTDEDCPARSPSCGCGQYPGARLYRLCASSCDCTCG
jgi:hypothetical protein